MQNAVTHRAIVILLIVLAANLLSAQQAGPTSAESKTTAIPSGAGPSDPAAMATAIRNSYYHPDEISGLGCAISVNWTAFFAATKLNPPAETPEGNSRPKRSIQGCPWKEFQFHVRLD